MPAAALPLASSLIRDAAHPLTHSAADYDPLIEFIGDARFVLLGEASHGTHEFYRERVRITKRLILEKGFTAVAVEADWPDAYRVNRYVQGQSADADSADALSGFRRFPAWMWRKRREKSKQTFRRFRFPNCPPGCKLLHSQEV